VSLSAPLCGSIWPGLTCATSCPSRKKENNALVYSFTTFSATLLDGGRTEHSALKLPINIQTNKNAVCNIKKHLAKVLQTFHILIWDECTMAHKHSLEVLNLTLKNVHVTLQNDLYAEVFSKHFLDIGIGKIKCHENTQSIKLPEILCNTVDSKNALVESVFPNICDNYSNQQ